MITKDKNIHGLEISAFDNFITALNGHAHNAIHGKRKPAFEKLNLMGFPTAKNETYKYTPIHKIIQKHLNLEEALLQSSQVIASEDNELSSLGFSTIQFCNGQPEAASIESFKIDGVEICTFDTANEVQQKEIATLINSTTDEENDAFIHLNTAFAKNGVYIKVLKNKVIENPIHFNFLFDHQGSALAANPRILIHMEKNAEAGFVETLLQKGSEVVFNNPVMEIIQEENAHSYFYKIQKGLDRQIQVNHTAIRQKSNATSSVYTISLDGLCTRNNLQIKIDGEGSTANMYGLTIIGNESHVDHQTVVDHLQPHCDSNELYKTVLTGKSKGIFNGRIFVREGAQKTNAFQSNNNILLSDEANMNTKPQLEIWADDVKCSHGATIGQLDMEQLFYLRARGIDKESATGILLHAFAGEVLDHVKHESVKNYLEKLIHETLENL